LKILRMINFILGIGIICFSFFFYFLEMDGLEPFLNIIRLFFPLMILLDGLQRVMNKEKKLGYFHIVIAGSYILGLLNNTLLHM